MMTDSDKSGKVIENKKRSDRNYKIFDGSVYATRISVTDLCMPIFLIRTNFN